MDELLDRERFPASDAVEAHLLDHFVERAYTPLVGDQGRYRAGQAQRTLALIAGQLSELGTTDLAWWQIPAWPIAGTVAPLVGVAYGAVCGSAVALVMEVGGSPAGAGIFGSAAALVAGFAGSKQIGSRDRVFGKPRPWLPKDYTRGAVVGLAAVVACGLGGGSIFGIYGALDGGGASFIWTGIEVGLALSAVVFPPVAFLVALGHSSDDEVAARTSTPGSPPPRQPMACPSSAPSPAGSAKARKRS